MWKYYTIKNNNYNKTYLKYFNYTKQGYNQIEEETETAGVTGLCISISLIVLSLFIYYAIKKLFLLLFTLIGIITIINSIKYLIYIKKIKNHEWSWFYFVL